MAQTSEESSRMFSEATSYPRLPQSEPDLIVFRHRWQLELQPLRPRNAGLAEQTPPSVPTTSRCGSALRRARELRLSFGLEAGGHFFRVLVFIPVS
jgi:hypothetical protein